MKILGVSFRLPLRPVIVTIRDTKDCIRVLRYSYETTITGWGCPPTVSSRLGGFASALFFFGVLACLDT